MNVNNSQRLGTVANVRAPPTAQQQQNAAQQQQALQAAQQQQLVKRRQQQQRNSQLKLYTRSLLDPFQNVLPQPKILDGKVLRSAGVRFRTTGEISIEGTTYIVLAPCLTAPMQVYKPTAWEVPDESGLNHISTETQRAEIDKIRTVGVGLKLNLMNSADQNEGYWEAARFNVQKEDWNFQDTDSGRLVYQELTWNMTENPYPMKELSNEPTYQRGKLRDIHRFMFRLNSNNTEHNLGKLAAAQTRDHLIDEDWDMIIIKIHGRVESGAPSFLNYEIVNNQEVVYRPGTAIARLMTPSPFIQETPIILGRTKIAMPGMKIE